MHERNVRDTRRVFKVMYVNYLKRKEVSKSSLAPKPVGENTCIWSISRFVDPKPHFFALIILAGWIFLVPHTKVSTGTKKSQPFGHLRGYIWIFYVMCEWFTALNIYICIYLCIYGYRSIDVHSCGMCTSTYVLNQCMSWPALEEFGSQDHVEFP